MAFLNSLITPARRYIGKGRLIVVKILLIAGVIAFSAYFAPRIAGGGHNEALILLLYVGVIGLLVLMRWPILGFFMVLIGGFFISYSGPGGINLALIGVALMVLVWLLDMFIKTRHIQLVASRTIKPLLIFILISFLSFGLGQLPWFSFASNAPIDAQIGGLAVFILSAAAFFMTAHLVREQKWLERVTWFFILMGGVYIAGLFLGYVGGIGNYITRLYYRDAALGSMFWTWLVALAFGQALINQNLKIGWRILLWGLVATTIYYAYFINGDWKSGYLPPIAAIGTILMMRYWRFARYGLILIIIPIWILVNQAVATDQYSYTTRLDAWQIVAAIAQASPILGLGFANYYWYTPLFPIRGYSVQFNSHSQYVDIFAQVGILGLFVFLWFFWETAKLGLDLRNRVQDDFQRAYVYSALGGLFGTLVAAFMVDWVLPFVYNVGVDGFRASVLPWIFLGGLVSIEQWVNTTNPFADQTK